MAFDLNANLNGREVIEKLIRLVARAFYSDEEIVMLDALLHFDRPMVAMQRAACADRPDLRRFLQLQNRQQVTEILSRLDAAKMACMKVQSVEVTEQELKYLSQLSVRDLSKRQGRLDRRDEYFWYIDYKYFFEQTLYRLYMVRKKLMDDIDKARDSQAYVCQHPQCRKTYDLMDLCGLERTPDGMMKCSQCRLSHLERQDTSKEMDAARELLNSLEFQLRDILELVNKGDQLCAVKTNGGFESSSTIMSRQQYEAERATSSMAANSLIQAVQRNDLLDIKVELELEEEEKRKRQQKQEEEGERRYKEKIPPWLRGTNTTKDFVKHARHGMDAGIARPGGGGVGRSFSGTKLADLAVKRYKTKQRQAKLQHVAANNLPSGSGAGGWISPTLFPDEPSANVSSSRGHTQWDPELYDHFVDLLGMRPQVEEAKERAKTAEFISCEDYLNQTSSSLTVSSDSVSQSSSSSSAIPPATTLSPTHQPSKQPLDTTPAPSPSLPTRPVPTPAMSSTVTSALQPVLPAPSPFASPGLALPPGMPFDPSLMMNTGPITPFMPFMATAQQPQQQFPGNWSGPLSPSGLPNMNLYAPAGMPTLPPAAFVNLPPPPSPPQKEPSLFTLMGGNENAEENLAQPSLGAATESPSKKRAAKKAPRVSVPKKRISGPQVPDSP